MEWRRSRRSSHGIDNYDRATFHVHVLSANPAQERQAVVTRVLSNREEGMGPEVDYYFAYWVEAHELPETAAPTTLVFERGNDGNVYLDGQVVSITLLQ